MGNKTLIVVAGPTAVGKTDFCVQLAKHFNTEIVSADSRQFYQEMQIGTAKPTKEEMQGVPHHLVDHISVQQPYTVADYEKEALTCINEVFQDHDYVILTGGSGLFIRAICEGIDEMPSPKAGVRDNLNLIHQQQGLTPLLEELKTTDPIYYDQVDRKNHIRIIRALELIRSTGKPFSSFRSGKKTERPFHIIKIGLNRDREELYQRINLRMDIMLETGLLEEAKCLYSFKELGALKTVGYQEIFDFWDGKNDWMRAVTLLKQNSRRYAKRQLTWFRKDKDMVWFHPNELDAVINHVNGI